MKLFPHSKESIGNVLINKTHLGNSFVRSSATFSQFFLVAQKIRQEWLGMTSFTRPVRWSGSIRFSWSSRWKWKQFHMFGNTIKSYHNIIFFHQNTHNRHPIAHTWGRGMGCLSWAQSTIYFLHSKRPTCTRNYLLVQNELLTHWGRDKMAAIFLNENVWISIKISRKFVSNGPINNIPALVQIMAWRWSGNKPLSKPMMASLLTHVCVTRSR